MEDNFLLIWVHTHTRGILILKGIGTTLVNKRPINPVEPEATRSVVESRKFWEKVMERIVKIEKSKTLTNTWRKTDKDKNKEWP